MKVKRMIKAHASENVIENRDNILINKQTLINTKIIWSECRFCTKENNSSDIETLEKWEAEYFETCGNIFDNPELLEVV